MINETKVHSSQEEVGARELAEGSGAPTPAQRALTEASLIDEVLAISDATGSCEADRGRADHVVSLGEGMRAMAQGLSMEEDQGYMGTGEGVTGGDLLEGQDEFARVLEVNWPGTMIVPRPLMSRIIYGIGEMNET